MYASTDYTDGPPVDFEQEAHMVMLDANGYEQLKAIIKDADSVIDRLMRERRIERTVLP